MIDILMATYNGEKYIKEQLDSILSQTFSDINIFISDDGSVDFTVQKINEYINQYSDKIFLVKDNIVNKGAAGNFLSLLKYSKAEYIMFADQDDVWKKDKAEKSYKKILELEKIYGKKTPLLIYSDLSVTDDKLNIIHKSMSAFMGFRNESYSISRLLVENIVNGNTILINRSLADKIKVDKDIFMHDWYISLIAMLYGKIYFIPESMTLYRQHDRNTLGAVNPFSIKEIRKYKSRTDDIKKNYQKMFSQAKAILDTESEEDYTKEIEIVKRFIEMEDMSRIKKIYTIFKYKFFKNSILMTIGMMFNI